ncbi:M20/M25/M40 family metallo-hydrolase [Acidipila sp. EB88]|uniref:M20/M25/M40 family metallo-hydrolase n=1 Tax=Acidipila sp. EB88 TaxID=2305226 RepID=UPI000F5DF80F|nr:M20/M25/M40 family metallo-hydrolase [Acidipila sp. EB88]RRA48415.1 M20/M25/M40 family metallo-hydrolase [Acidipila sp. EB88]
MQNRLNLQHVLAGLVLLASAGTAFPAHALSDGGTSDLDASGEHIAALPADPRIAAAIATIQPGAIRADIAALVAFRNRSTLSSMTPNLPPGTGATAAADWVFAQYSTISRECGGCLEVKRDTFTEQPMSRIPVPTTITNVYAVLKGTEGGNRTVLVTGHYDSRNSTNENTTDEAPGANDDASGVAVSIESARALSKMRFPATIIFAAVAGEEQGLNGSRHLAQTLKAAQVELEGVLNNDIVGGNTTPGDTLQDKHAVRIFSEGIPATATPDQVKTVELLGYESDSPSRELARAVTDVDATYFGHGASPVAGSGSLPYFHPVLELRRDRFLRGGDHTSFNGEGFTAIRFTEWREDFNHQHQNLRVENGVQFGDLIQYVDMDYAANVARLNAATLATLAAAPAPPADPKIVTSNLDNNTTLRWTPAASAPAGTHYQVLWRELSSSEWQHHAEAAKFGSAGTATLPVSKDNVIFGIRSVDTAGHASLAVVPYPVR